MTDHELQDLMRERVADLSAPDLSGAAWERASRIRRRRAAGVVVGAVASLAVVAVALAGVPGQHRSGRAVPRAADRRRPPAPSRRRPRGGEAAHEAGRALPGPAGLLGPAGLAGGGAAPGRLAAPAGDRPLRTGPGARGRPGPLGPRRLRRRRPGRPRPAAAARPGRSLRSVDTSRVGAVRGRDRLRHLGRARHAALADGGVPRLPAGGQRAGADPRHRRVAHGHTHGRADDRAALVGRTPSCGCRRPPRAARDRCTRWWTDAAPAPRT